MAKTKHTPGLWQTGALMSRVEVLPNGWNMPLCIADCGAKHSPESEDEKCANARLIAAAPDLLAACKQALKFIHKLEALYCPKLIEPNSNSGLDWDTRYNLQDAIAKAKGAE